MQQALPAIRTGHFLNFFECTEFCTISLDLCSWEFVFFQICPQYVNPDCCQALHDWTYHNRQNAGRHSYYKVSDGENMIYHLKQIGAL